MTHATEPLDGDGWVRCSDGHRHWGRYGAAGLLLHSRDDAGLPVVLLQHRAAWTHHGDTWGLPGGAKASWESPEQAAMRETDEEVELTLDGVRVERVHADDHGGWTYWTVVADLPTPAFVRPRNHESIRLDWVRVGAVVELELHPGFAATWPLLDRR
jgi:8-oxo-dGTP pyrophosphatase MutT (NUDIX family)